MDEEKEGIEIIEVKGCPDWMLTMGDCMSLLLCFFVLMLTFSTPDEGKLMDVVGGIKGALSAISCSHVQTKSPSIYQQSKDPNARNEGDILEGIKETRKVNADKLVPVRLNSMTIINKNQVYQEKIKQLGFDNVITLKQLEKGLRASYVPKSIFIDDTDKINKRYAIKLLTGFVNILNSAKGNEISITYHFNWNRILLSKRIPKSWTKNMKRNTALGKFLVDNFDVDERRLSYKIDQASSDEDSISITLMERFKINEITMQDFFALNKEL